MTYLAAHRSAALTATASITKHNNARQTMPEIIDGKLGPRTLRAIRKVLADDAERKIVAACIDSGHFDSIDEIRALLDRVKAGARDVALDDLGAGINGTL